MSTGRRSSRTRTSLAVVVGVLVGSVVPGAPLTAQEPTASPPPAISSWTSDRTVLREGDVVTILVDEYTLATANLDDLDAKGHVRDVGVTGGGPGSRFGAVLRSTNDVEDSRFGESSRRDRFQAEISARVVEVTSNAVRLEGTKTLRIDEHEQEVAITGWVRLQDIGMTNTVDSWRLAGAEITYASNGELGKTNGGFFARLLDFIIP